MLRPKLRWPFASESARAIEARTPPDRDRVADFWRAVAIVLVVLGHWLAVVVRTRDGGLAADRLLAIEPWTRWATWVFQVIPIFFLFGGFANARSWSEAAANREPWAAWMQRRAIRLLGPLVPLLAVWLALVVALRAAGWSGEDVRLASQAAFLPIWFLGIYLMVVAAVPLTWSAHRRWGLLAVVAFVALTATVDVVARFALPAFGAANAWIVWAAIHQCGYFWYEKRLLIGASAAVGLFAVGVSSMMALVFWGGFPVSMVTTGEGLRNNADPPTIAVLALFLAQLGVIVATRQAVRRWVSRPRVWAIVVTIARLTFTVYLWHMTALILVILVLHASGVWAPPELGPAWWMSRPLWIGACALALAVLVAAFHRFATGPEVKLRAGSARMATGLLMVLVGIAWVVRHGIYDPRTPAASLVALLSLLVGLGVVGAMRPPRFTIRPRPAQPS